MRLISLFSRFQRRNVTVTLLLSLTSIVLFVAIVAVRAGQHPQDQDRDDHEQSDDSAFHGIHKIKHIIIIMQENRSFDTYFGTYPGADGIPTKHGEFTVCVPDPAAGNCVVPFHNSQDSNGGGPHGAPSAVADIDGGKMDGFIDQAEKASKGCLDPNNP